MPELVLLSFDRREFNALHRAATKGDEAALRDIESIWDGYADREVECFLCGEIAAHPPFSMMLPERAEPSKIIAAPLCVACRDLPKMVRLNRVTKMARRVFARRAKQLHYSFNVSRR